MKERGLSNAKHRQQWLNTLETYVFPVLGAAAVVTITADDVIRCLAPIWPTKLETAQRCLQRLRAVMGAHAIRTHGSHSLPWQGIVRQLNASRPKRAELNHHRIMQRRTWSNC